MVEKKIGERLRETRKERGLTQKQVSEMLDISIDYVSRLEKGERTPSDRVRKDIIWFVESDELPKTNTTVNAPLIEQTGAQVELGKVSQDEAWLLFSYRKLDEADRLLVDKALKMFMGQRIICSKQLAIWLRQLTTFKNQLANIDRAVAVLDEKGFFYEVKIDILPSLKEGDS